MNNHGKKKHENSKKNMKTPKHLSKSFQKSQEKLSKIGKSPGNPGKKVTRPSPDFWPPPPAALLAAWDPELPRWPPQES